jgi:hypothetical protein
MGFLGRSPVDLSEVDVLCFRRLVFFHREDVSIVRIQYPRATMYGGPIGL